MLQTSLGDFETALKENITNVKPRDQYIVLVAGETSAGKSSVINLILGEDLLPHKILSTTSTICELKYGKKPKIGVHFKDTETQPREPMFHELVTDEQESYKEQIEKFVHLKKDREKKPYKKIELFWPHPLFKEGVMIVDSPGVGESEDMSEFVLNYLPHAFCFMYVINSANAGGIQNDRLLKILSCAQTLKKNAKMDLALFTRCALFVANMWDLINCTEREEVKQAQIDQLTKKLGNLDPKSQIVYLSCKNAQMSQKYGVITEDFNDLITGISNLVVSSMENNLLMYSRWLEEHLAHISRQIRIVVKAAKMSHQQTEDMINKVLIRMEELKVSQQSRFEELGNHQSRKLQEVLNKLVLHFKSEKTIKSFCKWSVDEAPKALKTWKETKGETLKYVSDRTHHFVQQWEEDNHEFAKAQVELIRFCVEKYYVMEKELRNVEDEAFLDDNQGDITQEEEEPRSKSLKTSTPMWLRQGLASVVVGSPRVFSKLTSKVKKIVHHKTKLESYTDDPCEYMSKRSRKCLKVIATQDRLLPFINEQLEDAVQFLVQIKEKIPQLMKEDEQLYQRLLEDKRTKAEIHDIYEPLNQQMEWLKSTLTVYILRQVAKSEFKKEELKCDEKWDSIIGSGSFSTVYKGVLARGGNPEIEVALKRYKDPLSAYNVKHFVEEERALRHLKHPNIVTFYGVDLRHGPNGTAVIIVLELCKCSLGKHVMSQPQNAPARLANEAVHMKVLGWAQDILAALRYLHSEEFVHRDLNLDNILLAYDEKVKLADVGVAKRVKDITGTVCGTPLYLAPEVYSGQIYNNKADMYSFGFVLWELWYGERAFRTALATKQELLEDILKRELRPAHIEGTQHPWEIWQNVMTSCWSKEPQVRLTAQRGWECLEEIHEQAKNHDQELSPPPPARPPTARQPPPQNEPRNEELPPQLPRRRSSKAPQSPTQEQASTEELPPPPKPQVLSKAPQSPQEKETMNEELPPPLPRRSSSKAPQSPPPEQARNEVLPPPPPPQVFSKAGMPPQEHAWNEELPPPPPPQVLTEALQLPPQEQARNEELPPSIPPRSPTVPRQPPPLKPKPNRKKEDWIRFE